MSIVQMSVQAGMLIAAIVIVRAIALYRLPKTSFLLLWGIVVARMLIPFSLTSRWSIYTIFDALLKPAGESGTVPSGTLPSGAWGSQSLPPISTLPGNAGEPSAASPALSISPLETLWIIGMVALFVVFTVMLTKSYWALRSAVPVTDNALIVEWRSTYRLHRPLEIVRSAQVMSPASLGILRPRIIFPQKMDMDDEQLIRYILVHEYVHIRRFDMLWKLAALCAVCVHWFNPLAWVMLFLLNRDLELSCDEMVLRHFGGTDRASYAHSLIDMAERNHTFFIASHFSKNAVEERIIAVMKYKKSSVLAITLVLALAVGMTTAFATSATSTTRDDGGSASQSPSTSMNTSRDTANDIDLIGEATPDECPTITHIHCNDETGITVRLGDLEYVTATSLEKILEHTGAEDITLVTVSPSDESKFSPEDWAKILEGIEKGIIHWEDDEPDENTMADCGNPVLVNYLMGESGMSTVEEQAAYFEYLKLKKDGEATTSIAPGEEIPVGVVTVGQGQSVTVSLVCDDPSEIEVGIKKPSVSGVVSSEKLVVDKADGSATAVIPVEESGEYVLYVKNVGTYSAGFSLSYLVR